MKVRGPGGAEIEISMDPDNPATAYMKEAIEKGDLEIIEEDEPQPDLEIIEEDEPQPEPKPAKKSVAKKAPVKAAVEDSE